MKTVLALTLMLTASVASAQVHVSGYTKKDGTYVAPHQRSTPNDMTLDNYSTKGNINPYTGKLGTKNPEPSDVYRPTPAPTLYPADRARSSPSTQSPSPLANPYATPQSAG
jgi:hypothetical protein